MTAPTNTPVGRWWLAYDDGAVWPCDVVGPGGWPGTIRVRPVHPAPDAGTARLVSRRHVYDSAFNHPTFKETNR